MRCRSQNSRLLKRRRPSFSTVSVTSRDKRSNVGRCASRCAATRVREAAVACQNLFCLVPHEPQQPYSGAFWNDATTLWTPLHESKNPCAALELRAWSCLRSVLRAKGCKTCETPQASLKHCGLRAADAIRARPSLGTCTRRRSQHSCSKGRPRSR